MQSTFSSVSPIIGRHRQVQRGSSSWLHSKKLPYSQSQQPAIANRWCSLWRRGVPPSKSASRIAIRLPFSQSSKTISFSRTAYMLQNAMDTINALWDDSPTDVSQALILASLDIRENEAAGCTPRHRQTLNCLLAEKDTVFALQGPATLFALTLTLETTPLLVFHHTG